MKVFWCGLVTGFVLAGVLFGFTAGVVHHRNRVREVAKNVIEQVERQREIDGLRENYSNLDSVEFL